MIAKFGTFEYALAERYRFEDELGRGAMGIVYRATDVRLGRPVAIKLLHPALTNELGVARFQSEIRIAAGLHHPNILGVHDSGESDGRLFYVMEYVGGETLRALLQREKQLSVDDALSIVEQVAAGLQYAHDHGIVHRDVKPENILVVDGRACIMDFGLARAMSGVDAQRLTASGLAVGTPHYLSPEQASAEKEIGPKADQYALACVLYEMLAGEPPFTGPTASAIAMRHISEQPAPLRLRRRSASIAVERAVLTAMEKVPGDRFQSIADFAGQLKRPMQPPLVARVRRKTHRIATTIVAIGALAASVWSMSSEARSGILPVLLPTRNAAMDTTHWAVVSIRSELRSVPGTNAADQLVDAVSHWRDIRVSSPQDLEPGGGSQLASAPDISAAARSAARVGAGRFILGEIRAKHGATRLVAQLYSTYTRKPLRGAAVVLPNRETDSAYAHLVFALLFGAGNEATESAAQGTRSSQAFASYLFARRAASRWALSLADSSLLAAISSDPTFSNAQLLLAEVRFWEHDATPEVGRLASNALHRSGALSRIDVLHARALSDMSGGRYGSACARFDSLTRVDSLEFASWFGDAECNRLDNDVVARNRGYAFRASRWRGLQSLDHAFELLPMVDSCCVARVGTLTRRHYVFTASSRVRRGHLHGENVVAFGAYSSLADDTLRFVPVPLEKLSVMVPFHDEAVDQQRRMFATFAAKRLSSAPKSAEALALFAEAADLLGDRSAMDTLRQARRLTAGTGQAVHLAVTEILMRVKYALPANVAELVRARVEAESLLANTIIRSAEDAAELSSVAALLGDANMFARLSMRMASETSQSELPGHVQGDASGYLAYAAMGGPVDSLREFESRVATGISNGVLERNQVAVRGMWMGRAAALAFPVYQAARASRGDTTRPLVRAELAFARGDHVSVLRTLTAARAGRMHIRPVDVTLDAVYPEAWLLFSIGEVAAAMQTIGPTLKATSAMPVATLKDPIQAAALLRSVMLYAEALHSAGARAESQQWARAAVALTDTSMAVSRMLRTRAFDLARQ